MVNSGMMICSFYLKRSYKKGMKDVICLNNQYTYFDEDKKETFLFDNVFNMIDEFCGEHFENVNDTKRMKTFFVEKDSIKKYDETTYHACSFVITSGAYGIESDLTDSNTNEVLFHRDTHIADNKKFNVLIYVPKDQGTVKISKGIIIFQTIATYGIKSITVEKMQDYFRNIGLSIQTRSVSVKTLIEKLIEEGNLYKITFIKDRVSVNSADNILINTGAEELSYIKPQLKPIWLAEFLCLFDNNKQENIYEIGDDQFRDIKVQFQIGKRVRTASLRSIDKFSIVEDFPEYIYNNGKYDSEKLINYMIETANEYKEKMVFTIEVTV